VKPRADTQVETSRCSDSPGLRRGVSRGPSPHLYPRSRAPLASRSPSPAGPAAAGAQGAAGGRAGWRAGPTGKARPPQGRPARGGAAAAEGYGVPYILRGAQARAQAVVLGGSWTPCRYSQSVGRRCRRRRHSAHRALAAAAAAAAEAEAPRPSQPLRWCSHLRSHSSSSLRSHHGRSGAANAGVAAAQDFFPDFWLALSLFFWFFSGWGGE
jgi:hypothetical protein